MLKVYVGFQYLELSKFDLARRYVGQGKEAKVYRFGDEVLKIYKKNCKKDRLDEETACSLSKLETKRVLLPKRIIRSASNVEFIGYSLKAIDKKKGSLSDMSMSQFIDELDMINDDLFYLANLGVEVEDFHLGNCLYDGRLFITDPGDFIIKQESIEGGIYRNNLYTLNRFVKDDVFGTVKLNMFERQIVEDRFEDFDYIGEQLRTTVLEGETIKSYVKRMTK